MTSTLIHDETFRKLVHTIGTFQFKNFILDMREGKSIIINMFTSVQISFTHMQRGTWVTHIVQIKGPFKKLHVG